MLIIITVVMHAIASPHAEWGERGGEWCVGGPVSVFVDHSLPAGPNGALIALLFDTDVKPISRAGH